MNSKRSNENVVVRRLPVGARIVEPFKGECALCRCRKPEWILGWTPEDDIQRRLGMSPGEYRDMFIVLCPSCVSDRRKVVASLRENLVELLNARDGFGGRNAVMG